MEVGALFLLFVVAIAAVTIRLVAGVFDGDLEGGAVVALNFENGSSETKALCGTMFIDDLSQEKVALEVRMFDTE